MPSRDISKVIGGAVGLAFVVIVLILTVVEDREQRRLIATGQCEARGDAWYQPPPSMTCALRDSEGDCRMWQSYQRAPYLRTYWVCSNDTSFWRRTAHE
jgi:hypothetical protein